MKYYLLFLLFIIMGAGARTMFEIAYHGAVREHQFAPGDDTAQLMLLAGWYLLMMVLTVLLLNYKEIRFYKVYVFLLSIGVFAPTLSMYCIK